MRRLHSYARSSGRSGSEWLALKAVFKRIGFYRRVVDQEWSSLLTERSVAHGVQIAHFRIEFSRNFLIWRDEKQPRIERRFH